MHKRIICLFFVFIALCATVLTAQTNDFLTWSSVGLDYKVHKHWDFELETQFRLKDNSTTVDEYFAQFQTNRKLYKGLKLGFAARYIRENDNQGNIQGYENHFRYHIDLRYRAKANRFRFKYRVRYQRKNELRVSDEARQFIRFKSALEYQIKDWKLDPEFAAEWFNRIADDRGRANQYRLTFGTDYKLKNAGKLGIFLRFQSDLEAVDRERDYILGVKYRYTIK